MFIKSILDLQSHPQGEQILKIVNRHIHRTGAEFSYYLPSHLVETARFINLFQRSNTLDPGVWLSRYSPYETQLIFEAMAVRDEESKNMVTKKMRVANRLTSRFIHHQINRLEIPNPLLQKIKKVFKQ